MSMYRKSAKQKQLEYLGKYLSNGYQFALVDELGEVKSAYLYQYETKHTRVLKGQKIVKLKELFDSVLSQ
nr:hypothetical protein [Proteus vulgaris]